MIPAMIFWIILAFKVAAALLGSFSKKLRRAAVFLAVSTISDLGRMPFSIQRAKYPKPYVGWGFALWLPEQALVLAIPTTLFGLVFGWRKGLALWLASFGAVAVLYPTLRGEALLRAYWSFFGAVFLTTSARVFWKSLRKKITKEDALLLLFGLAGLGDIVLVRLFQVNEWWGVLSVNGAVYLTTIAVAIHALTSKAKLPVQCGNEGDDL